MINIRQKLFHTALKGLTSKWLWEIIPCTRQQYNACQAAWNHLAEESWDEQACAILMDLLPQAQTQENCWDWLTAELYFEAYALALDNRAQAAIHYLKFSPEVTDETLDRYNQRMKRFSV